MVPAFFSADETAQLLRFTDEAYELPEIAGRQMIYREPSLLDSNARVIQRIENFCPHHVGFDKLIRGSRLQRRSRDCSEFQRYCSRIRSTSKCPAAQGSSRIRISKRVGPNTRRCS